MPAPNTAYKTAPPPKQGGASLPLGNHPGNTGGKAGRSGRKPDEFKARMRAMVSSDAALQHLTTVLENPTHPQYMAAFKMAAEFGYGKANQSVEHSGKDGGAIAIKVTHRVIDPTHA